MTTKLTFLENAAANMRADFLAHVKPEVVTRRHLGAPMTWTEVQGWQCNSYEWQHLLPLLDDDALLRHTAHALANSNHGGSPLHEFGRPCASYDEQLERCLVPMLMQRLAAARGIELPTEPVVQFEVEIDDDI